jgi:hypothetical protein
LSECIYDSDTDSFTEAFDPEVVFRGRIARSFNRNPDPEIKKEVHTFMFEDPYTKQQLDEHVPLFEQIAYARALWGDYLARKFYFLVGGTSTGKGVRTIALKQSCGSFVGEFNINNFAYNPNNGADEAKQLSWLLPIVHTRIALSNEARSQNTVLCGALIKQVVSGGDTLTMRRNYQDESHQINTSTLFMMCNDIPTVTPFRPDREKPRIKDLKDKFNKPEYQDAFLSILLDAYQQYKSNNHVHHLPASVKKAMEQWVSQDGLEALLEIEYETHMDDQGKPIESEYVPYEELDRKLRIEGVGPEKKKVHMSQRKLAMELTRLGYTSDTKRPKSSSTKKTCKVRLGLRRKPSEENPYAFPQLDDGGEF